MQRIWVTGGGITVTSAMEPLVSIFGKEMRPGSENVFEMPWGDISQVSIYALELPPDGDRWITLVVDVTWGEFFEVHEDAVGFADAVRELSRLSGVGVPDSASLTTDGVVIWQG